MLLPLAVLTGLVAVAHWYAVARGRARLEWWTKPLTMVALAGTVVAADAAAHGAGRWLLAALACGLVGDIALLRRGARWFLAGVTAFLLGHLAYLACFLTLGFDSPGAAWVGLVLLLAVAWLSRDTAPAAYRLAGAGVAAAVAVYSVVIGAALVAAWWTGLWTVAAGATIFAISDAVIGMTLSSRGFERAAGPSHLLVMVTYHLGQFLIALGVVLAVG